MPERVVAYAPGRVNLIGEHTDYNDGLALPFATTLGVTVVAEASTRGTAVEAVARDLGESDRFTLPVRDADRGWRAFVRGVCAELAAAGHDVPPCRLTIAGDLPRGAGLASSAALSTALCLGLLALAGEAEPDDRRTLARLCSRVENDWVGAQTGLLDQLAVLFGRSGHAQLIDFASLAIEDVPLELGDWSLCTYASGAVHDHASSGYRRRREECRAACRQLGVASLRSVDVNAERTLPDPLRRRVRHVRRENARVTELVEALGTRAFERVGELLAESHASLRDDYEVSVPEVEATVARLRAAGAAGARIVGGGFGGQVLALFGPDVTPPPGGVRMRPSAGARVR